MNNKDRTKFYIPLPNKNGSTTVLNAKKIKGLAELIPTTQTIQENLLAWDFKNSKFGTPYKPLIVKVTDEQWEQFISDIRSKKPKHIFVNKSFYLVSDTNINLPLVTIVNE